MMSDGDDDDDDDDDADDDDEEEEDDDDDDDAAAAADDDDDDDASSDILSPMRSTVGGYIRSPSTMRSRQRRPGIETRKSSSPSGTFWER